MSPQQLACRIREIREEFYGKDAAAIAALAREMGLPPRTWENFERGVTMPAEILLRLLSVTGMGLDELRGERSRHRAGSASPN